MKALVHHGPGQRGWDTVEDPTIIEPTGAIVSAPNRSVPAVDPRRDDHDGPRRHVQHPPADAPDRDRAPRPSLFATHHFALDDAMSAYDTFADAASANALKVVLQNSDGSSEKAGAGRAAALA